MHRQQQQQQHVRQHHDDDDALPGDIFLVWLLYISRARVMPFLTSHGRILMRSLKKKKGRKRKELAIGYLARPYRLLKR